MDRRDFFKTLSTCAAVSALPMTAWAQRAAVGHQQEFLTALQSKPWLLGYLGTSQSELKSTLTITDGRVPEGLNGRFFRNGPAYHNLGPDRFLHWFDAPGMVQKFDITPSGVSHHGRFIDTPRNRRELSQREMIFTGFGTSADHLSIGGSADGQNTANISFVEHNDELLALWEAGSPHRIDPDTLQTLGQKNWSAETTGLPFGAHPRIDTDGSMWNIGYSVNPSALIVYQISASGSLLQTHVVPKPSMRMVHDFVITPTKLAVMLAPFESSITDSETFVGRFEWNTNKSTEILVFEKSDLSQVITIEIDPFWVFHFGNAYDVNSRELSFDFALHDTPNFMLHDAFDAMDGSWDGRLSSTATYAQMTINLDSKTARLHTIDALQQTEFIQTHASENLADHRFAVMLGESGRATSYGFDRLILLDRYNEQFTHFDAPATEMMEEHVIVPKQDRGQEFWIIGTSLDWASGQTRLSIYDSQEVQNGPICKASLDYALPLGLHGLFLGPA